MHRLRTTACARPVRRRDATSEDRGFALVWFALVLVALLTLAGAAVDVWDWWYNGNQNQRTADSASLAGAVFLPGDQVSARSTAFDLAVANGADPSEITIETSADDTSLQANELRVTISNDVDTRFLRLVGVDSARITRDATAQYTSRLPMGSPEAFLGRDPERGLNPGYWLSISGRDEHKVGGDRFQNEDCGATYVFNCNNGRSTVDLDYSPEGYAFSIELNSAPTGDLVIEAYDPVHTESGSQNCTNQTRLSPATYAAKIGAIQLRYPGDLQAAARYAPGDTIFCSGDVTGGNQIALPQSNVTTFVVRQPDNTQANDFDNPPVEQVDDGPTSGCTRQFRGLNLAPFGTQKSIYEILAGEAGSVDPLQNAATADAYHAVYRQWVRLCTIPAATVQNWYTQGLRSVIIQVRSNANLNAPYTESTTKRPGRNHFSLRAGYGSATGPNPGVNVFAQGRLPMHNAATGSNTEFFLTRVPPGNAGRTLALEFFDIADASGPATFTILPPTGFGGSFSDCTFVRKQGNDNGTNSDVGLGGASASGCTLSNLTSGDYNGRNAEVRVRVPTGYTCVIANILDCWIKVKVQYSLSGTVNDHTTWTAGVVGEPVRLIE